MAEQYTAFRSSFWVTFVTANVIALFGITLLTVVPAAVNGRPIYLGALLVGIAGGAGVGAVLTWGVVQWLKTYVGPETLRCTDAYGRYLTVTWGSIRTVRPIHLGLPSYLRVTSTETDRVIWVALFLTDMPEFAALVAEYAGDDNPLAAALAEYTDRD